MLLQKSPSQTRQSPLTVSFLTHEDDIDTLDWQSLFVSPIMFKPTKQPPLGQWTVSDMPVLKQSIPSHFMHLVPLRSKSLLQFFPVHLEQVKSLSSSQTFLVPDTASTKQSRCMTVSSESCFENKIKTLFFKQIIKEYGLIYKENLSRKKMENILFSIFHNIQNFFVGRNKSFQ